MQLIQSRVAAIAAALLYGTCPAALAADQDGITVWERDGAVAMIDVGKPSLLASGLISVTYRLVAINGALATPEMVVSTYGAGCQPRDDAPFTVLHFKTTVSKHVGNKWVVHKQNNYDPPQELEPSSDKYFLEMPAKAACAQAWRIVRRTK